MKNRCVSCKHWIETLSPKNTPTPQRWGGCEKILDLVEVADSCNDGFFDSGVIEPFGNFGCVLWEAKE